jgi:polysaccharide export outer membrane protein
MRLHHHGLTLVTLLGACVAFATTLLGQGPLAAIDTTSSDPHPTPTSVANRKSVLDIDSKYVIGPDDVLAIDVWHEQELSRTLPVRLDGKISLPLLGEVTASGETPLQLQDFIAERLKEYLEHPHVTVIVQQPNSHSFNVVGEVQKPGAFVFGHRVCVVDAIAQAGGLRDFAKPKKMYVLRTMADGSQHKLPVNYNDVIRGKNPSDNIVLEPHDTVVVP